MSKKSKKISRKRNYVREEFTPNIEYINEKNISVFCGAKIELTEVNRLSLKQMPYLEKSRQVTAAPAHHVLNGLGLNPHQASPEIFHC